MTDFLQGFPALTVPTDRYGVRHVRMRGPGGIPSPAAAGGQYGGSTGGCSPDVFLDGRQVPEDLLGGLWPDQVRGIEIYVRPSQVPTGYINPLKGCGAILVWTQPPPPKKPKPPKD